MALPNHEWLHIAQTLGVGRRTRAYHLHERTPALTVGNDATHYWAYCQRCKQGGRVDKEHVNMLEATAPAESNLMTLPEDMVALDAAPMHVREQIEKFLQSKNMTTMYLPPGLHHSKRRARLLIPTPSGYLGRDLSDGSTAKWLTYAGQHFLFLNDSRLDGPAAHRGRRVVVVEDPFSYYKLAWLVCRKALRGVAVACSLGTRPHPKLVAHLLQYNRVAFFYDGDAAGRKGSRTGAQAIASLGIDTVEIETPWDLDPKDLNSAELLAHLETI
jgi:hypothetical protein